MQTQFVTKINAVRDKNETTGECGTTEPVVPISSTREYKWAGRPSASIASSENLSKFVNSTSVILRTIVWECSDERTSTNLTMRMWCH
jgi:hypothetical protein